MCFPANYTLVLEDSEAAVVRCPLSVSALTSQPQTALAADCGIRRDERYTATLLAENRFRLNSSSNHTVIICKSPLQYIII